ncbi:MAG: TonB family protein [Candidatus Cryptobacteroides sp.]
MSPFSWMKYIVIPAKDMTGNHSAIISHELAHIRCGHSMELLLVDLASAFQWFNPAVWMLRSDLQELHEYEADDAVLRTGADIKEYQYLLIRKAVGRSGYSIANSFNHSILKNRITMMSKSKSPLLRGFRSLYLLPIVCLGIGLQAKTVYVSSDKDSKILYILRSSRDYEGKEISRAEFEQLDRSRIESIDVIKNSEYCEKYGKRAEDGVVVVKLKREQELPEIVVVKSRKMDAAIPFYLLNPDTMPKFQGGDMKEFCKWLNSRLVIPETCTHSGTMKVSFVVDFEGNVINVEVDSSVCEELDAMVVEAIKQSPKWEPATCDGKPCDQCLVIPIEFRNR